MDNSIKIARRFCGMGTMELGERINVSRQQVYNWESGFRSPSRDTAQNIASVLDVDVAWVLGCPQSITVTDPVARVTLTCPIIRTEEIDGYGILHHVYMDETGDIVPVLTAVNGQFTPCDWQAGDLPKCAAEIPETRWMDQNGRDAVMFENLPRCLAE